MTATPGGKGNRWRVYAVAIEGMVASVLLMVLLFYASLGRFTRYVADDYSTLVAMRVNGFWTSEVLEYKTVDGHYIGTAVQDAAVLLPGWFDQVLPGLLLVGWVVALLFAFRSLLPSVGWVTRVVLAAAIVTTLVHMARFPFVWLYWMTASLTHITPIIVGLGFIALAAAPRKPGRLRIVAAGVIAFVAAGFEETFTVAATVALAFAVVAAVALPFPRVRNARPMIFAGMAGAVVGFALLAAAPGNRARYGVISHDRPSVLGLPDALLQLMPDYVRYVFSGGLVPLCALAVLAALLAVLHPSPRSFDPAKTWATVGALIVAGAAVVVASLAPAVYATGLLAPAYDLLIPTSVIVGAIAGIGWVCGLQLRHVTPRALEWRRSHPTGAAALGAVACLLAATFALGPGVASTVADWRHRDTFAAFAATKDAEEAAAQTAARQHLSTVSVQSVYSLGYLGLFDHGPGELTPDPSFWINSDEAEYYRVASITAPDPP